jgi:hypothetical protein
MGLVAIEDEVPLAIEDNIFVDGDLATRHDGSWTVASKGIRPTTLGDRGVNTSFGALAHFVVAQSYGSPCTAASCRPAGSTAATIASRPAASSRTAGATIASRAAASSRTAVTGRASATTRARRLAAADHGQRKHENQTR